MRGRDNNPSLLHCKGKFTTMENIYCSKRTSMGYAKRYHRDACMLEWTTIKSEREMEDCFSLYLVDNLGEKKPEVV